MQGPPPKSDFRNRFLREEESQDLLRTALIFFVAFFGSLCGVSLCIITLVPPSTTEDDDSETAPGTCPRYRDKAISLYPVIPILGLFCVFLVVAAAFFLRRSDFVRGKAYTAARGCFYLSCILAPIALSLYWKRISDSLEPESLETFADIDAFEAEKCPPEMDSCDCPYPDMWVALAGFLGVFCFGTLGEVLLILTALVRAFRNESPAPHRDLESYTVVFRDPDAEREFAVPKRRTWLLLKEVRKHLNEDHGKVPDFELWHYIEDKFQTKLDEYELLPEDGRLLVVRVSTPTPKTLLEPHRVDAGKLYWILFTWLQIAEPFRLDPVAMGELQTQVRSYLADIGRFRPFQIFEGDIHRKPQGRELQSDDCLQGLPSGSWIILVLPGEGGSRTVAEETSTSTTTTSTASGSSSTEMELQPPNQLHGSRQEDSGPPPAYVSGVF